MPDISFGEYEIYWVGAILAAIIGATYAVAWLIVKHFKK
jgi:hypothetical protein